MTTRFKKNRKKRGATSAPVTDVWESTASILEVAVTQEACTTTASSSTSTIRVISAKSYFHRLKNRFFCPTINIDKLWSLLPESIREKAGEPGSAPLIDVGQFGYFKVLGKGQLPEVKSVVIKTKLVSKNAEKKIKANGGAVVLTA